MAQFVSGLILVLMFGLVWLILPFLAMTIACGVAMSLGLAAALNGLLVIRRGRRYSVRSVFAIMLAVLVVGLVVQPGLALLLDAAFFRLQGDVPRMHQVLRQCESWPWDFRNLPARWIAAAGLRRHYGAAVQSAQQAASDEGGADQAFAGAFAGVFDDLATRGSPQIVIDLEEEVDAAEPPEAKTELLAWQLRSLAADASSGATERKEAPKPLEDLATSYSKAGQKDRTALLVAALTARIAQDLPAAAVKLVALPEADGAAQPRVVFHGRVRHSGHFLEMSTSYGYPNIPIHTSGSLYIVPVTDWEVQLFDGAGNMLGETKFTATIPADARWSEQSAYGITEPQVVPRKMGYQETAREFVRRIGLKAGPEPKEFK